MHEIAPILPQINGTHWKLHLAEFAGLFGTFSSESLLATEGNGWSSEALDHLISAGIQRTSGAGGRASKNSGRLSQFSKTSAARLTIS